MARYPDAAWRPLPEAEREPLITATQVIVHTAVSGAASLFGYFSRTDVDVESHFYVNQTGVEQYVDTGRQADANRNANARAISWETWDSGDPEHTPWTSKQLDLLAEGIAWCCRTHDIPPVQCASPTSPGIGWHSMWGAPSDWTPVAGKTCPAGPRIAQMPDLIARVRALVNNVEDDMTPEQATQLAETADRVQRHLILDRDNFLDPTAHKAGRANAKSLVIGALGTGLRKPTDGDPDGTGDLRAPFKELLREVLDEAGLTSG